MSPGDPFDLDDSDAEAWLLRPDFKEAAIADNQGEPENG